MTRITVGFLYRDGRVLLGKRSPSMRICPGMWDAVGGHVDQGESSLEAVRRELAEEIGIDARDAALLGSFQKPSPVDGSEVHFHIHAIRTWSGEPYLANLEHTELRWFLLHEAQAVALSHPEYVPLLASLRMGEVA